MKITPIIISIKDNGFSEVGYSLNKTISSDKSFNNTISHFFKNFISNTSEKYFLLLRLKYQDGSIKTLHKGIVISVDSLDEYINYCHNILSFKSNDYTSEMVYEIFFNFFCIDKDREKYYIDKWSEIKPSLPITIENFSNGTINRVLPTNQDYLSWGIIILNTSLFKIINTDQGTFKINTINGISTIEVFKAKNILFKFIDTNVDTNMFIREMDNIYYFIKDNKIVLTIKQLKTKFLTKIKEHKVSSHKIITIDIETVVRDGIHKPYLFSMYDGSKAYSWFSDNPKALFDELLKAKYKNYTVYAHNLSMFDIIFLFKYISSLSTKYKVDIIKKDDKIISIKIFNRNKNISLTIKDSYLLLPASLKKLSIQFNTDIQKGIEPVYHGDPKSSYFMKDISHYSKDVEKVINLEEWKDKITKYCEMDCISLYQILIKFRELVFNNWNINIDKYPTTPSLAYAIFRKQYLKANQIPLTTGKVFDFIKDSFTGGSTEMYKPHGTNLFCYDVNSLYPASMKFNKFPVGDIIMFEGDITILSSFLSKISIPIFENIKILDDLYWFADVDVNTKKDLYQPYLQIHYKSENGLRTVSPNGSFQMKINSCEYFNALKDYNINIKNGYLFKSANIFESFVNNMYELRSKYPKTDPMNLISKLIMNSLYGRFAMKPIFNSFSFCSFNDLRKLTEKFEMVDILDLGNNLYFIEYSDPALLLKDNNISVGISSAVTAYSRVFMSHFKNNENFNLYYTDTDSIFIDKELDSSLISTDLGKFKLEYIFREAIFLGPKIYAAITSYEKYICKIKGYKDSSSVSFDIMKSLLSEDTSINLSHTKWFRSLTKSEIHMKNQLYELQKTDNKRDFIYENGIAIDTKAFTIDNSNKV